MVKEEDTEEALAAAAKKVPTLGTSVASGAVLFILLRIMAVAHWDWNVAGLIADSMNFNDTIGVVLGTLFGRPMLMSIGVLMLTPLAGVDLIWQVKKNKQPPIGLLLFVPFLVASTVALSSTQRNWWLPAGIVALFLVLLLLRIYWRTKAGRQALLKLFRATWGLAAAWVFLFAVLIDTPWMGRERIQTTDQGVVDGYVLQVSPGFVRVLDHNPRKVRFILTGNIQSRTPAD